MLYCVIMSILIIHIPLLSFSSYVSILSFVHVLISWGF
jgi:hypothetical protein